MTVFARQLATATRLIAKNGAACVWHSATEDGPPVPHAVKVVLLPNNLQGSQFFRLLTGQDVQSGNMRGLMASVDFTPSATGDVLEVGGASYRILSANPLQPDGTPLLWTLELAG